MACPGKYYYVLHLTTVNLAQWGRLRAGTWKGGGVLYQAGQEDVRQSLIITVDRQLFWLLMRELSHSFGTASKR